MTGAEAIQKCIDKVTELTLQVQDLELRMKEMADSLAKLHEERPPWD